ncbi:MAG: imidazolonepropionase [Desulfobacteraceae bacterium]|nr:MAG: imidazolonepropionase [Desulfobacteraceae bacterium]
MNQTKLFYNAHIYTPVDPGHALAGPRPQEIRHWEQGALLTRNGLVAKIGPEKEVRKAVKPAELDFEFDCKGQCLIPGFVDPHTHMCFAARREEEFQMRMQGAEYLEILKRGGGILSSVQKVRATGEEELFVQTRKQALAALSYGTTTLEIKSGYGLDTATELKMLRAIDRVGRETALDVIPTFLGAHAVPAEFRADPEKYVELMVQEMIPAVAQQGLARFCDIFCEQGVFSIEQSRKILQAAQARGLKLKIHADEVHDLGGAGLAADLKAVSAEHLLAAGEEHLKAMAKAGTIAVLLPVTAYSLRKPYAEARSMIAWGLPVALATDCNPGSSYTESMPFVFSLAVVHMRLSLEEALIGATLNAAYALDQGTVAGSLDVGKKADFLILDGTTPIILAYHAGVNPVSQVFKAGELVACNGIRE